MSISCEKGNLNVKNGPIRKFNGKIMFDIIGHHEVLKVKVVWVSNIAFGAERRIFMTHVLTIDEIHYI